MHEMLSAVLAMDTNSALVNFVLNNLVLLMLIKYAAGYVCKKTPWAVDDDFASFLGGLIDIALTRKKETSSQAKSGADGG